MRSKLAFLRTLGALAPTVLISIGMAALGLQVIRACVPIDVLRATNDVVGNYLQTLGTIYAVLLAFVVFVVWTQFNDARANVERETNELGDLARCTRGFPQSVQLAVRKHLLAYIDAVLDREWASMARRDETPLAELDQLLDELADTLHAFEPCSDCHRALYSEVLARFNDLSDARASRLTSSRSRIPLMLTILLYSGAFVVVGSMYLFAVDSVRIHTLITCALSGAVSHLLYVIHDLDDCFGGDFQVSNAGFKALRARLLG